MSDVLEGRLVLAGLREAQDATNVKRFISIGAPAPKQAREDLSACVAVLDTATAMLQPYLRALRVVAERALKTESPLVIHCVHGSSRSAAVVASLLRSWAPQCTLEQILRYISHLRAVAHINEGFLLQLSLIELAQRTDSAAVRARVVSTLRYLRFAAKLGVGHPVFGADEAACAVLRSPLRTDDAITVAESISRQASTVLGVPVRACWIGQPGRVGGVASSAQAALVPGTTSAAEQTPDLSGSQHGRGTARGACAAGGGGGSRAGSVGARSPTAGDAQGAARSPTAGDARGAARSPTAGDARGAARSPTAGDARGAASSQVLARKEKAIPIAAHPEPATPTRAPSSSRKEACIEMYHEPTLEPVLVAIPGSKSTQASASAADRTGSVRQAGKREYVGSMASDGGNSFIRCRRCRAPLARSHDLLLPLSSEGRFVSRYFVAEHDVISRREGQGQAGAGETAGPGVSIGVSSPESSKCSSKCPRWQWHCPTSVLVQPLAWMASKEKACSSATVHAEDRRSGGTAGGAGGGTEGGVASKESGPTAPGELAGTAQPSVAALRAQIPESDRLRPIEADEASADNIPASLRCYRCSSKVGRSSWGSGLPAEQLASFAQISGAPGGAMVPGTSLRLSDVDHSLW